MHIIFIDCRDFLKVFKNKETILSKKMSKCPNLPMGREPFYIVNADTWSITLGLLSS